VHHRTAVNPEACRPQNGPDGGRDKRIKGFSQVVGAAYQVKKEPVMGTALGKPGACRSQTCRIRPAACFLLGKERAGDGWGRGLGLKGLLVAGPV
jgi:hypothetical protein